MGATLKKRWETRDQMIESKPGDQKELRILNRTLRWCKDGLVFGANLEVVDELGLSKSKPVSSRLLERVLLDAKMMSPSHSMRKRNACIIES